MPYHQPLACSHGRLGQGAVLQKILRLRFTLRTSLSSWSNTTSAILCQQTIGTTSFSHSEGLVTFENSRNHKIIFFVKCIFAPDIYLRLRSLLRFFCETGPRPGSVGSHRRRKGSRSENLSECLVSVPTHDPLLVLKEVPWTRSMVLILKRPCRVGLVVSVSSSHTVGREFASRPGHTKDHHKNSTNCLPAWHAMR